VTNKVRVNLANARALLELVGISESAVETIVRFRAEQVRSRRASVGPRLCLHADA
jgi:DNA uptake protein ComE-like DNA-binding protein